MATARELQIKYKTKDFASKILKSLLVGGAFYIAASSPYFIVNLTRYCQRYGWGNWNRKSKKQLQDTFSYLKSKGFIRVEYEGRQIHISLTEAGKKKAKYFQINELEIQKPKKWDKKWRLLFFDVPEDTRVKREVLRGKLKELNFYLLQKSVWVHPYKCDEELKLLQDFFGFDSHNYLVIEASSLGRLEGEVKEYYKL